MAQFPFAFPADCAILSDITIEYLQSRNLCVKCPLDGELPKGRKGNLRYGFRIPLLQQSVHLCTMAVVLFYSRTADLFF